MSDVLKLKNQTGAGLMDCKKTLEEVKGDYEKAVALLRERGLAKAAKKEGSDRINSEGYIFSYAHQGAGRIVVIVEINCETDFAAKAEQFQQLGKDIAMHIAASNPQFLDESQVPAATLKAEQEIFKAQAKNEGKPDKVIERMVEGRIKKYYEENCLVHQPFVKDPSKTVAQLVTETVAVIGEKISIRRFVRWEVGEGLEKKEDNFAEEVAKQVAGQR